MDIFYSLLIKLLPLYFIIFAGYIAGKYFRMNKEFVATVVIYVISPIIFFNAAATAPITIGTMLLPFATLLISSCICLLFLFIGGIFWRDETKNILAFIAPEANTGYFGLPVALLFLSKTMVEVYIVAILGILVYENTLGFFIAARGRHTHKESFMKLFKLPVVYAVVFGFIVNSVGMHFSSVYSTAISYIKIAYVIFGMMTIGLGLSGIKKFSIDFVFVGLSFLAKFVMWPLFVWLIIIVDGAFLHIFDPQMHNVLILISLMPIAANTVAFATMLRIHPEKVAVTVVLSTVFALLYVPLMVTLFLR